MRKTQCFLFLTVAATLPAATADDTSLRLQKAVTVLNTMTESKHGIRREQIAAADSPIKKPFAEPFVSAESAAIRPR